MQKRNGKTSIWNINLEYTNNLLNCWFIPGVSKSDRNARQLFQKQFRFLSKSEDNLNWIIIRKLGRKYESVQFLMIKTSLRTRAWTGVPSWESCFTNSYPTPLLPPATKTGDFPKYFEAIIVRENDDTEAITRLMTRQMARLYITMVISIARVRNRSAAKFVKYCWWIHLFGPYFKCNTQCPPLRSLQYWKSLLHLLQDFGQWTPAGPGTPS